MEEKHEIITPKFTTKTTASPQAHPFRTRLAAQIESNGVKLTVFKGASSNLAVELAKVIVRYAR
ncbi:hypothetical protein [Limosilactobacillus sp.]|jgi:hypothetical protein|uniref:hypothetical protein n=1 Tax=Limosilactobacillus sp. TaxID=2773925 RepID=UPI0025C27548|nr:hypothetical protein [Limosilactobacillus sp.]MCH3922485.1 hypothetical protein [Limosilactobacillus sp.]MCH3927167.1 hypothetical protein [Limosilactobacillus sp.]